MQPNHKRIHKINTILFEQLNYKLRPIQEDALEWVKKNIFSGKKFLILELPTGSGKSILSQYIAKFYIENVNSNAKIDMLTNTKILQKQYFEEFNYINNLWGKANYDCSKWNHNCEYGSTCNKNKKTTCDDCPYQEAKSLWLDSKISLTNFHIHGHYALYNKDFLNLRNSDLLILDEAHLMEEILNSFVSFDLSPKQWKNIIKPELLLQHEEELNNFSTIGDIAHWIDTRFLNDLSSAEYKHRNELDKLTGDRWEQKVKTLKEIEDLKLKLNKFLEDYKAKLSEWIIDKKIIKGDLTWSFQPLWTGDILSAHLWSKYKHVILLSGTIIDQEIFSFLNGIDKERSVFLSNPSPFRAENRKIYYYPLGKLNYKSKEDAWKKFIPVIKQILEKYKGVKGNIHTGNYEIFEWIKRDITDNRLVFAEQQSRDESLQEHINREDDCVIVSPSMMHGIDLKDDLSRFQIIIKIPYPSLSSKVNSTRVKSKYNWYSWKTVCDIIQAYGRPIRSSTDYADTFILDECFGDMLRNNYKMFPKYFLDAIKRMKKR